VGIASKRQPVIIMGMHRSGTTMLADLLGELGLFLGHKCEQNHEALYFLDCNNMLLRQARASWDSPSPIRVFLKNADAVAMTIGCLKADILSHRISSYLGLGQYVKYRSLRQFDRPWGWKDPRNVFTLPLWLMLFPRCKIIYVVRNGVDVARSLLLREQGYLRWQKARFENKLGRLSNRTNLERVGFRGSVQCLSLKGCFSLWEEYVAQADDMLASIGNDRLVVKYEEFTADPVGHVRELVRFCGLTGASMGAIREASKQVDVKRASAYESDPGLKRFYQAAKANYWMILHGYAGPRYAGEHPAGRFPLFPMAGNVGRGAWS
jgi:hypothetical protein